MDNIKILLVKYYTGLVNSVYKLLPLFEGRKYKTSAIFYSKEEAYKNYQIYLTNLLVEIHGNSQLFFYSESSIKLCSILKGMIELQEHSQIKRLTMECINICKKIINEIEESD